LIIIESALVNSGSAFKCFKKRNSKLCIKMKLVILAALALGVMAGTSPNPADYPAELGSNATFNTCGGNCPSNDCAACPCGETRAPQNIETVCAMGGGWSAACCHCIVTHESGGNAHSTNQNHPSGSYDVGVWQINHVNWAGCSGGAAPCTVAANHACAVKIFAAAGHTWRPWSTCSVCGCCSKA